MGCGCMFVMVSEHKHADSGVDVCHHVYIDVYEKFMFMNFVSVSNFGRLLFCFVNV